MFEEVVDFLVEKYEVTRLQAEVLIKRFRIIFPVTNSKETADNIAMLAALKKRIP